MLKGVQFRSKYTKYTKYTFSHMHLRLMRTWVISISSYSCYFCKRYIQYIVLLRYKRYNRYISIRVGFLFLKELLNRLKKIYLTLTSIYLLIKTNIPFRYFHSINLS